MAITTFGNPAISQASNNGDGYTSILLSVPAPSNGVLRLVEVYCNNTGDMVIRVFRDDGTNYVFVGQSPTLSMAGTGLLTFNVWIPVLKGDYLAQYTTGSSVDAKTTTGSQAYRNSNTATTLPKTDWGTSAYLASVQGYIWTPSRIMMT